MTVAKQKKSSKGGKNAMKKTEKALEIDFSSLDSLMEKIDTLEIEEQVSELFEADTLLKKSLATLLKLAETEEFAESDEDFDCERIDENVMGIMEKFLDEGIVDEEEFEDFFTEELAGSEDFEGDSESEELESEDSEEDFDSDQADSDQVDSDLQSEPEKKKKSKHLRELEILMEKVDDESDFTDEDDLEEEGEDNSEFEDGKKDIFEEDGEDEANEKRLSSFEKSQAALKAEIAALESENLQSDRPWALRGEINARQRPSDSLLEEAVDFDSLARPTPQITEERTEEIEDLIKRRIEEAAWDDVERKDGRDLTLLNGMHQQGTAKSARPLLEDVATAAPKQSLAQVYESEAETKLTGNSALDTETRQKQAELTALFAKICRHVDGLSGNRFAPKVYVQSDFQIKTLGKK